MRALNRAVLPRVTALDDLADLVQPRNDRGLLVRHAQFQKFALGPQLRADFREQAPECPRRSSAEMATACGYFSCNRFSAPPPAVDRAGPFC